MSHRIMPSSALEVGLFGPNEVIKVDARSNRLILMMVMG